MITTKTLTANETMTMINGPAGKLEVVLGEPTGEKRGAWGLVCHPHPLYGGTMNNKVVTTLTKTFQALGVNTVRFNFRGVGLSEGKFDKGNGELEDLMAVLDWVQQQKVNREIWLGGFSFGAYIAAKAATQLPVSKLVTVAPPVQHFAMQNLPPVTCAWVLAQGLQDEVIPASEVLEWAESRNPKPVILTFPEATHYFHGLLTELRTRLEEALRS